MNDPLVPVPLSALGRAMAALQWASDQEPPKDVAKDIQKATNGIFDATVALLPFGKKAGGDQ